MAYRRPKPEEVVSKLRQVQVLMGQGMPRLDAIRQIGVVGQTFYRWHRQYSGIGVDQLKELKRLQKDNERLRRAVLGLTLDKLPLKEAAMGNFSAPFVAELASIIYLASSRFLNAEPAGCWDNIALRKGTGRKGVRMRIGWLPT